MWATCLLKCAARPGRKFLNSTKLLPPRSWVYHVESLPAPFPILIPLGLRDRGRWGNIATQKDRFVQSDFREDRLRKSFSRKIRFAEIRKGFNRTSAKFP